MNEGAADEPEPTDEPACDPAPDPPLDPEAEHELIMAAARRVIAADAAIIHRLGTV